MNTLINAMTKSPNVTYTENGAKTFDQTGSKILDLFSRGGAYRSRSESDVTDLFASAFIEDNVLALKALFYLRDIRGGQGERRFFRLSLAWLAKNYPEAFIRNIENVVTFGRFDDLFVAFDTAAETAMVEYVKKKLASDARETDDRKLSLLAKWMPSNNTSSAATRKLAYRFQKAFKITAGKYRKTLSALRTRLNVVEKTMSIGNWSQIDFEKVPSKANLLYRKAFSRQQPDRYTAFIKAVQSGDAKINAGTLYPYEIVRDCAHGAASPTALDVLWKNLPDYLKDSPYDALVLPDVSGSMMSSSGGVVPLHVSVSLAIYFAQRNKGFFKDHFLEFSSTSKLVTLKSKGIVDAWNEVRNSTTWCGSTNLQSAFDAILTAAVNGKVKAEDMPKSLIIISDMEFDQACSSNKRTNFEEAKRKYRVAGYEMPNLVFWNVNARNDQSPVKKDENGTALVSGCSPSIFKQLLTDTWKNPYDLMLETLNSDRYSVVG